MAVGNASLIPDARWEERDGQGGTAWAGKTTLIIRQNQRVHHAIVELLDQLVQEEAAPTKTFTNLGERLDTSIPGLSRGSKPVSPEVSSPIGGVGAGSTGDLFNPVNTKAIPVRGDTSPKR